MPGIPDPWVWLAYVFCLLSALAWVIPCWRNGTFAVGQSEEPVAMDPAAPTPSTHPSSNPPIQ